MNHQVEIGSVTKSHGYPYRATCSCGWQSNTYCAEHAAQGMAEYHLKEVG
jgi:hypothetical protein